MALDAPGGAALAVNRVMSHLEPLEMGGGDQSFLGLPCQALPLLLGEQVCVCEVASVVSGGEQAVVNSLLFLI